MKILCICYEYPPVGGGGATVCQQLNEALVAAGHEIHIVTSWMKGLPNVSVENGVHVHRVHCFRRHRHYSTSVELLTQLLPSYRAAIRLARDVKFDLIHCHFVVPSGLVARWVSKATGLPYVITAHGSDIPEFNPDRFDMLHRVIAPVWRRILSDASRVTVSSRFLRNLIAKRSAVPVDLIPNGFDLTEPNLSERRNRILVASRIVERKGIQDLIRALAHCDTDWEICIAGDGPYLRHVKSLARELGVDANFLGFVGRKDLQAYYDSSKLFVFPSHQENFPMVLVEAMAAGCAVISTNAEGCVEVARSGALFYDPGDTAALSHLIKRAVNDPELIYKMQAHSLAAVRYFDIKQVAREFLRIFNATNKDHGRE